MKRIKFYGAIAVFAVAGILALPGQANGQTSIPAGCAVSPCRVTDGNDAAAYPTPVPSPTVRFTG